MNKSPCLIFIFLLIQCSQWNEFHKTDVLEVNAVYNYEIPKNNKKNVIIVTDELGTEITDLLIPFYIFSASEKFNVLIVSKNGKPVSVWKGLHLLPHSSIQDLKVEPDIIILPAVFHPEDKDLVNFIRSHSEKKILSVCEGARLIGESAKFNHYKITTHASSIVELDSKYNNLIWEKNKRYIKDKNLFSTAGVSSAVEGSLAVVEDFYGKEEVTKIIKKIHYPKDDILISHRSEHVGFVDSILIVKKLIFDDDPVFGFELVEGIDEFMIASYLDTFNRTFPSRIETFGKTQVTSRYGLKFYKTQERNSYTTIFCSAECNPKDIEYVNKIVVPNSKYYFDSSLEHVQEFYGERFMQITKRLLDY